MEGVFIAAAMCKLRIIVAIIKFIWVGMVGKNEVFRAIHAAADVWIAWPLFISTSRA